MDPPVGWSRSTGQKLLVWVRQLARWHLEASLGPIMS